MDEQSEVSATGDSDFGERHRSSDTPAHQPVMTRELIELLAPRPGQVIVDCTAGAGGHSLAILPYLMPDGAGTHHPAGKGAVGRLIGIDCDAHALQRAQSRLVEFRSDKFREAKFISGRDLLSVQLLQENFRRLPEILASLGVPKIHGLIADLGFSSLQVDQTERGFSFLKEGPLDMRLDQRSPTTAAMLIQRLSEQELADLLQRYGEERWARRIAKRIVSTRKVEPIRTTIQLARVVADAVPRTGPWRKLHPATRTFQALRIAVNEELSSLGALLDALPTVLMPGGRAVIITFHSLEDRPVKQAFQQSARAGLFRVLTKKPLRPSEEEVSRNPRSRSAKLRAVERL